ncbi:phytanoyl-CoA dioxygenase family protein [Methylobacterium sp. 77]|uniref:phytanoyl-CoA dioxygenase family protein n=1 Tax=Methylobacterium sp. 77 TaxID=1101192 RepID=UPI0003777D13|nr:phytanoyl-CoA dioxygenase family protein [Methylobacterium sp. 77]
MAGPAARDIDWFDEQFQRKGWVLLEGIVPAEDLAAIRTAVLKTVDDCGRRQVEGGATASPDGTAHHSVGQYAALDGFLERDWVDTLVAHYFGGDAYILHAFNPASVGPAATSYLHRIHRDVRTFGGDLRLMLNMLVMVDPFTTENGATHVLSGSHHSPTPPPEDVFWAESDRLVGPAGSIVLFDSNLWHAAGSNRTDTIRTALTLSFSRAFVKQQMDYPRFLGRDYGEAASPRMRQLLGFNAMVPVSYEEFYQPAAKRLYKADQG